MEHPGARKDDREAPKSHPPGDDPRVSELRAAGRSWREIARRVWLPNARERRAYRIRGGASLGSTSSTPGIGAPRRTSASRQKIAQSA